MGDSALSAGTGNRSWGGTAAIAGAASFVAVVLPLHFLQPGYDAATQLMSELALGAYGGAMFFAFAGLAVAVFGVQAAIAAAGAARSLRILLSAAAIFFLAAGVFPLGPASEVHIAAIATAFVLSVLAMYLYPAAAGRAAAVAPRSVSWTLAAGVAGSVALGHSLLPMGVGQRLAACSLLVWLAVVGYRLRRTADHPPAAGEAPPRTRG